MSQIQKREDTIRFFGYFRPKERVTKCGDSNFFIIWKSTEGVLILYGGYLQ